MGPVCALLASWAGGCGEGDPTGGRPPDLGAPASNPRAAARPAEARRPAPRSPWQASAEGKLFGLYHAQWVTGDLARARAGLAALLEQPTAPPAVRGRAALRLAEIADTSGNRRAAVGYLSRVAALVGPDHPLGRTARDWRDRIRIAVPLAEVRGPAPGSVVLAGEPPAVTAGFRRAEKRLVRFYRIVVAPRLDNVDAVVRTKRGALGAALKAYREVAQVGGPASRAVAHYRMGAMFHHFAEALAFDLPAGLLPSVAQKLTRKLRTESVGYLRKALSHYNRSVAERDRSADRWRRLAQREAKTLRRVLGGAQPRRTP